MKAMIMDMYVHLSDETRFFLMFGHLQFARVSFSKVESVEDSIFITFSRKVMFCLLGDHCGRIKNLLGNLLICFV